ncbi:MAG: hypothetical protein KBT10_00505 [Bacteroidales bacterium]|nr:hypothetical protein [Candidatus Sodaliphilus aphodohippi]
MKSIIFSISLLLFAMLPAMAQYDGIHEGSLVFVVSKSTNPITSVTGGIDSLSIDHVAIMHRIGGDNGPLFALEAIPEQVSLTPIENFLADTCASAFVLASVHGVDVGTSVHNALKYVGRPYDHYFMLGDSAIYCSELVQISYVDSFGKPIFETVPMTFRNNSGEIPDFWVRRYGERGMAVPEGAPGTNPGEMSRRSCVNIIDVVSLSQSSLEGNF